MAPRPPSFRRALPPLALALACAWPAAARAQDSIKAPQTAPTVTRTAPTVVRQAPTVVRQAPAVVRQDTPATARPSTGTLARPPVVRQPPATTTQPPATTEQKPPATTEQQTPPRTDRQQPAGTVARPPVVARPTPPLVAAPQDSLVVVPQLMGITVEDARDLLKASGLGVGALDEAGGRGVPGTVMRQAPRAGSRVEPGTAVRLTIVEGRRAVMPAIMGLPLDRAQAMLREAGLRTGEINGTDVTPASRVRGHTFRAGDRVRVGESVNLWMELPEAVPGPRVAQAPPPQQPAAPPAAAPTPTRPRPGQQPAQQPGRTQPQPADARPDSLAVPDVRALALAQAREALEGAGFAAVFDSVLADSAGWTVASQEPAAGARVAAGSAIRLALVAPPPVLPPTATAPPAPAPAGGFQDTRSVPAEREVAIPWLWIILGLLLLAAAGFGARRMMRSKPVVPPLVRVQLRAHAQPRTAVQGDPFAPGRVKLRVLTGTPAATVSASTELFAQKEVAGG